jgi:hypothetical protein
VIDAEKQADTLIDDILLMPYKNKTALLRCLSKHYRHNEVWSYIRSCKRWKMGLVDVANITIGGIVGLETINYNNRHRMSDLAKCPNIPLNFDGPVETINHFIFIGIEDKTPIENDDVSHNVRLIDGVHRVIQLAQSGQDKFNICVGFH